MKFDYSRQFAMMEKVPDLKPVFKNLRSTVTPIKRRGDKVGLIFFTLLGTLTFFNFFNIDYRRYSSDYSNGFRVLPDYMTGTTLTTYRKERKDLII